MVIVRQICLTSPLPYNRVGCWCWCLQFRSGTGRDKVSTDTGSVAAFEPLAFERLLSLSQGRGSRANPTYRVVSTFQFRSCRDQNWRRLTVCNKQRSRQQEVVFPCRRKLPGRRSPHRSDVTPPDDQFLSRLCCFSRKLSIPRDFLDLMYNFNKIGIFIANNLIRWPAVINIRIMRFGVFRKYACFVNVSNNNGLESMRHIGIIKARKA